MSFVSSVQSAFAVVIVYVYNRRESRTHLGRHGGSFRLVKVLGICHEIAEFAHIRWIFYHLGFVYRTDWSQQVIPT